jgi:16S rRNA processing protein RimM
MSEGRVQWVELGRIGSPYGVKGWVHVHSYTDPPQSLLGFACWSVRSGDARSERRLLEGRVQGRGLVVRLSGITDRNGAARLRGAHVEVARSELPAPQARQFYRADLIGLNVRNLEGAALGSVAHFVEAPGHALMVVQGEREHWIPATPQHLHQVDLAAGWVIVDWPAVLD